MDHGNVGGFGTSVNFTHYFYTKTRAQGGPCVLGGVALCIELHGLDFLCISY